MGRVNVMLEGYNLLPQLHPSHKPLPLSFCNFIAVWSAVLPSESLIFFFLYHGHRGEPTAVGPRHPQSVAYRRIGYFIPRGLVVGIGLSKQSFYYKFLSNWVVEKFYVQIWDVG